MIPESRLIKSELTLRELSLPDDVLLARKSMVRWLALSLGMILPNESRKLLLDILEALVEFQVKNENPTTKDILARLEEQAKAKQNPKAVYYHLKRLTTFGILIRKKGRYHLGNGDGKNLKETFRQFYLNKVDSAFSNIAVALDKLEHSYK